ncbi:MAG TPA: hypothetical protein VFL77_06720 [Solirubrobacterales bacterium]|nr:hypothetical protein [Solirubrobacterales bacterium]
MKPIVDSLKAFTWSDRHEAHTQAACLFDGLRPEEVLAQVRDDLSIEVERSVEKTTHYKWFLGEGSERSFELWLHEYKPSNLRRTGHATVAHNHRFWLTSLILRGGFSDTRYARVEGEGDAHIEPIRRRPMEAGNTMVIGPDEIHSLSDLRDGTISVVVQSRPLRSFSEVFENGEVRRYSDLEAKLAELRASL